ncbi:isoprenylcysteine carboxyl methyltransferase family protein [Meiothermus sp.]|jgi:methyltransferase|uniref:isoprenylcysteine carboxyl methyltransferase family protein n=1 Tax=Meiothermus sp. TaxID=1955249 RepID=UPI0021DBB9ED|nr:isoprenylcysteine carboxylmethyltransferase family protein [Meiothermus sp.]GIW23927.1 MAG: isoprenylcysteine carboxyl methyltransferase [Meiothermus sp.]
MVTVWVALAWVALQRLLELRLAQANLRWALARGGREYGKEHYPLFFLLHIGWMLGWLAEGLARNQLSPFWGFWLALFLLAQGLRYWAIQSLGRYWNTRIIIVPGAKKVTTGPYRYIAHPNYLAVALELFSLPLVFNAWITALVASFLNALLLLFIRIPAEEKALGELAANPEQNA